MWSTNYQRVIPRDLFNESKLLEQIGRVCLAIHEWRLSRLTVEDTGDRFDIQLSDSGGLYVDNLTFRRGEEAIEFRTSYNSRVKNPLLFKDPSSEDLFYVFDDQGEFTSRFYELFS